MTKKLILKRKKSLKNLQKCFFEQNLIGFLKIIFYTGKSDVSFLLLVLQIHAKNLAVKITVGVEFHY